MPERRGSVNHRLTVVFKLESGGSREAFDLNATGLHPGKDTLERGASEIHEALRACVEDLIEAGLLPPWSL